MPQTLRMTPVRFLNLVDCAMCAWEYVLSQLQEDSPPNHWQYVVDRDGMAGARNIVANMVNEIQDAYDLAVKLGYESGFDWEFIPVFMKAALDDSLNLKSEHDRKIAVVDIVNAFKSDDAEPYEVRPVWNVREYIPDSGGRRRRVAESHASLEEATAQGKKRPPDCWGVYQRDAKHFLQHILDL